MSPFKISKHFHFLVVALQSTCSGSSSWPKLKLSSNCCTIPKYACGWSNPVDAWLKHKYSTWHDVSRFNSQWCYVITIIILSAVKYYDVTPIAECQATSITIIMCMQVSECMHKINNSPRLSIHTWREHMTYSCIQFIKIYYCPPPPARLFRRSHSAASDW